MKCTSRIILLALVAGLLLPATLKADQYYNTNVTFTQNNDGEPPQSYTTTATFSLRVPTGVSTVRGLITLSGTSATDGMLAFAKRNQFAIVNTSGMGSNYTRAYGGSGQALLNGISNLATLSSRPELNNVPMILTGYSMGGQFSYEFSCWKPERTLAYATGKGGYYFTIEGEEPSAAPIWHVVSPAARNVPGILMSGSQDNAAGTSYGSISYTRQTVLDHIMDETRPYGSRFSRAMEWGATHVYGNVEPFYYNFFDAVIKARMPNSNPLSGPVVLNDIPESAGWLADDARIAKNGVTTPINPQIASYNSYVGDKSAASWLPDANTAAIWRAFSAADTPNTTNEGFRAVSVSSGLVGGLNDATVLNPSSNLLINIAVDASFGNVVKVEFYDGATKLGEDTTSGYSFNWNNIPVGSHGFYAVATDSLGNVRYSLPRWVEVVPEPSSIGLLLVGALGLLSRRRA